MSFALRMMMSVPCTYQNGRAIFAEPILSTDLSPKERHTDIARVKVAKLCVYFFYYGQLFNHICRREKNQACNEKPITSIHRSLNTLTRDIFSYTFIVQFTCLLNPFRSFKK